MQRAERCGIESEQIGDAAHQAPIHQLLDEPGAETVDIQGAPAHKVAQGRFELCRAHQSGAATQGRFAVDPQQRRGAHRAVVRRLDRRGRGRALCGDHRHDLRNHIAGPAHHDRIPVMETQTGYLVHIVQAGTAHGDPAHEHGLQARDGRDGAGATDLKLDPEHGGHRLLRRKLARDGPARRARDSAECALRLKGIDLVHDAVDIEGQFVALRGQLLVIGRTLAQAAQALGLRADRQTPGAQALQQVPVRGGPAGLWVLARGVGAKLQRPLRGNARIELTQRAGRGVARVDEGFLAGAPRPRVQGFEAVAGHKDFPAHLEARRPALALQAQGHGANGAHIARNVLAADAVTARRRALQYAADIDQAHGDAVELGFGDQRGGLGRVQAIRDPAHKGREFVVAEGVVQRQHGHGVGRAVEGLKGRRADALCGRRGVLKFGVRGLDLVQAAERPVVFGVGRRGRVKRVVLVIPALQTGTQALHFLAQGVAHGRPRR